MPETDETDESVTVTGKDLQVEAPEPLPEGPFGHVAAEDQDAPLIAVPDEAVAEMPVVDAAKAVREYEIGGPEELFLQGGISPEQAVLQQEDAQARLRRGAGTATPADHRLLRGATKKVKRAQ